MEQVLGLPAVCDNNANCCAWGALFGIPALGDQVSFAALTGSIRDSGLSCGFAFVLGGGEVYHGNRFSAGEFRSIFCADEGDRQFASAQTSKESLTELCRSTAFLLTMLNLDAVVLAGTLTAEVENFRAQLHREIRRNRHYRPAPECPVYCAPKGEHAAAFGAAALFLQRLCRIPVLGKTGSGFDGRLFQQVFGNEL